MDDAPSAPTVAIVFPDVNASSVLWEVVFGNSVEHFILKFPAGLSGPLSLNDINRLFCEL